MNAPIVLLHRSILIITFFAILGITLAPTLAEDGAHGGETKQNDRGNIQKPGPAVQAPRITERFTEKGMAPNPIAIDFDPQGNVYVVEASRAGISVIDNRNAGLRKSNGVINDLQKISVEDRLQQIEMLEEGGFYPKGVFEKADDKVRFLQDTDGDGVADKSTIFAENFNDKLDGIAAGVLWHEGKVYLTNIPHLWLLEDKDGDGDADRETQGERISMSDGYGIRWAFYGHDMHGLIKGHDGRIYWSIGDRGYNVTTKEGKHLYGPAQGAVFRMWPDGSGLEVFHEGLRNPQELAFDNYGNLFTGDNNSDSGDRARFVFVAEGGHSGWNQDVQSLNDRGPWNREHMWKPRFGKDDPSQPAWIIPPIANVGRGPSGLAHYPGVGDAFAANGSFLMCDYPAGVRHVQLKPRGAFFQVVEDSGLSVDGATITDVAWGYDGRLYLSDWGGGWKPNPNGYLFTMTNKAAHQEQAALIKEVKDLFANGFDKLSDSELYNLLGHRDQRVRLNTQWELAKRPGTTPALSVFVSKGDLPELDRLHALWALGMQARKNPATAASIVPGLRDQSDQVRAHAASLLGDLGFNADDKLVALLNDDSPVVRYHAAIALGKTGTADHIGPLLDLLDRNDNTDAVIRHGVAYGLSLLGERAAASTIYEAAIDKGPAARLGAVLALRRLKSGYVERYLRDEDPRVAAEAARAIYDMRLMEQMPLLAALSDKLTPDQMIEPIMRRVIEANVRLADAESAMRLMRLASNDQAPEMWRILVLKELDQWSAERNREGVWGHWWPRPEQTMDDAVAAMLVFLPSIIDHSSGEVQKQARVMQQQHLSKAGPDELAQLVESSDELDGVRISALHMLVEKDIERAIQLAGQYAVSGDSSSQLRQSLAKMLRELDKDAAAPAYLYAVNQGELSEKQNAVRVLANLDAPAAQQAIADLAKQLERGEVDPALRLDVYETLAGNENLPTAVRYAAQKYAEENAAPGEEPFIRDAVLAGGSVQRGFEVFEHDESASCVRCHGSVGSGAVMVGPPLDGIGARRDIGYLYTALVHPSRHIAEGYASSEVRFKDGSTKSGRVVATKSDKQKLILANSDGVEESFERERIESVAVMAGQSQMPTMTDKLSPVQMRDVLAYLGSLQDAWAAGPSGQPAATAGPRVITPAKDLLGHALLLPGILLGLAVLLGVLLVLTIVGTRAVPH